MNRAKKLLSEHGYYCATVHGCSMNPLLFNHRDSVYIKKSDVFKKYDVVLFERKNEQLVLHRIIGFDGDFFIICGDNDFIKERIHKSQVIGVMTEFSRNGKEHTVTEPLYVLYSRIWCFSFFTKRVFKLFYRIFGILRKRL